MKDDLLSNDPRIVKVAEKEMPPIKRDRPRQPTKDEIDMDARITNTQPLLTEVKAAIARLHQIVEAEPPKGDDDSEDEEASQGGSDGDEWGGFGSEAPDEGDASSSERLYDDNLDETLSDDGWESGSVDDSGRIIRRGPASSSSADDGSDDDDHISMDSHESDVDDASNPPPAKRKKVAKTKGDVDSIFLPSLASGFVMGDDDGNDEWRTLDIDKPVRKNRRGQRARRMFVSTSCLSKRSFR